MKKNKIELSQILISSIIILGFSLTLISFFQEDISYVKYRNIIFWLIIIPFGMESILVCIASAFEKYRKVVDLLLIICFISFFISLIILFSYGAWPKLTFLSKYSNVIGIVSGIVMFLLFTLIYFLGAKYENKLINKIHLAIYNLGKRVEKGNYIHYCVIVSDDTVLQSTITKIHDIFQFGTRVYTLKDISLGIKDLKGEDILLITDSEKQLIEIISQIEKEGNKIVAILTRYTLSEDIRNKLSSYVVDSLQNI